MKADPKPINLGNNVNRIRRFQKGNFLELKKFKEVTALNWKISKTESRCKDEQVEVLYSLQGYTID